LSVGRSLFPLVFSISLWALLTHTLVDMKLHLKPIESIQRCVMIQSPILSSGLFLLFKPWIDWGRNRPQRLVLVRTRCMIKRSIL
jgi:hypothetical protein